MPRVARKKTHDSIFHVMYRSILVRNADPEKIVDKKFIFLVAYVDKL